MSAIYKIIGEDGKEYGPVTGAQLRQWIAEGRVESRTPVFVTGAKDWNFVGLGKTVTIYDIRFMRPFASRLVNRKSVIANWSFVSPNQLHVRDTAFDGLDGQRRA
jgi:hypothetical protein